MKWDERLVCYVSSISYDFEKRHGVLKMPADSCCDMTACINLFLDIDRQVELVETFAGRERDTSYRLQNGSWRAEWRDHPQGRVMKGCRYVPSARDNATDEKVGPLWVDPKHIVFIDRDVLRETDGGASFMTRLDLRDGRSILVSDWK